MKARVEAAGGVLELVRLRSTAGIKTYNELLKYALPKEVKKIEDKITEIKAKELAAAEKMKNQYEQKLKRLLGED
jgi:ribosomal protein L14E/L6E/L27E